MAIDAADYTKIQQLKEDYDDQYEFLARFILDPNIENFRHLDKNLLITNLSGYLKEPEQLRILLDALHILTNYTYPGQKTVLVGEEEIEVMDEETGEIVKLIRPVYKKEHTEYNQYPKSTRHFLQKVRSFALTAAARGGFVFKEINTKRFKGEESVEDRTYKRPSVTKMWSKRPNSNSEEGGRY